MPRMTNLGLIVFPLIFFFIEAAVFGLVFTFGSNIQNILVAPPVLNLTGIWFIDLTVALGYILQWLWWIIATFARLAQMMLQIVYAPITVMVKWPITIPIHLILILMFIIGLIRSLKIFNTGVGEG
jgi:hypothetical protein